MFAETFELTAPEGVFLGVVDARLDLALVPRHRGHGWLQDRPVLAAELDNLAVDIRIEPIGPKEGTLRIVNDQPRRHPAKVSECVFRAPDERVVVGRQATSV